MPELQDPKKRETSLQVMLRGQQDKINEMLPEFMKAESGRFLQVAIEMVKNEHIAKCTPVSIIESVIRAAQWGLIPDGVHGAMVAYGNTCTFIPMYRGLIAAYRRSGQIKQVWADMVFEEDEFTYERGMNPTLKHLPLAKERARPDKVTHAYACARWDDGFVDFVVMSRDQLDFVRSKSRAQNGPWKTDTVSMMLKSPLRMLSKFLPLEPKLQRLVTEDEKFDQATEAEVETVKSVTNLDELVAEKSTKREAPEQESLAPMEFFTVVEEAPAVRDVMGIPVDGDVLTKWDAIKDKPLGGEDKLLAQKTPLEISGALGKGDATIKARVESRLAQARAMYADGKTPPQRFMVLALAAELAELGEAF